MEVAFQTLRKTYPNQEFESRERRPIQVTLLGAGSVGVHVVQAAIRYGDPDLWKSMAARGLPGVQVSVVDYDTTRYASYMREILAKTDLLVDATQRPDPSQPVIPNPWIAWLPEHAVLLDLSVDPYNCDATAPSVKGIEGIPQGNLDQYVFAPDDPAYDAIPACFSTARCFEIVEKSTSITSTKSQTQRSSPANCSAIQRRVGWASAFSTLALASYILLSFHSW